MSESVSSSEATHLDVTTLMFKDCLQQRMNSLNDEYINISRIPQIAFIVGLESCHRYRIGCRTRIFSRQQSTLNNHFLIIMKQMLGTAVRRVDIFGVENSFMLGGKFKYRSKCSGCVSLCICIFFLTYFWVMFSDLVQLNNVTVYETWKRDQSPPLINLTVHNRSFGIKVTSPSNLVKKHIHISLDILNQPKNSQKSGHNIPLRPCKVEDFLTSNPYEEKFNPLLEASLQTVNISEYMCPETLNGYTLGGTFEEEDFQYLRYQIKFCTDCQNQTTLEKVLEEFKSKNQLDINMLFINLVINANSPHDPYKPFVDKNTHYSFNPVYEQLESDIFFREYIINDFYSLLDQSTHSIRPLVFNEVSDRQTQKNFQNRYLQYLTRDTKIQGSPEVTCAKIFLRRSEYTVSANRLFETIGEALAYIGGLLQFAMVFFTFIFTTYNRYSFMKTLANHAYRYINQEDVSELQGALQQSQKQSKDQIIYQNSNLLAQLNRKFKIKLSHYLYFLQSQTKEYFLKRRNLQVAMEVVSREIDFFRMLKVMQDVERIKYILFSQEQLKIFNKLPKPNISIYRDKRRSGLIHNFREQMNEIQNINDYALVEPLAFRQVYDDLEHLPRYFKMKLKQKQQLERDNNSELVRYLERQQIDLFHGDERDKNFAQKVDGLISSATRNIVFQVRDHSQNNKSYEKYSYDDYIDLPEVTHSHTHYSGQSTDQLVVNENISRLGMQEISVALCKKQTLKHFFPSFRNIHFGHILLSILLKRQAKSGEVELIITNQTSSKLNNLLISISPQIKHSCNPLPNKFLPGQRLSIIGHIQKSKIPIVFQATEYPLVIQGSDVDDFIEEIISIIPSVFVSFVYDGKLYRLACKVPDWNLTITSCQSDNFATRENLVEMFVYILKKNSRPNFQSQVKTVLPDFSLGQIYQIVQHQVPYSQVILFKAEQLDNKVIFYFDQDSMVETEEFKRSFTMLLLGIVIDINQQERQTN